MDPYDILDVDEHASKKTITTKYRFLVRTTHPDKGGDSDKFDAITKAYKILSDDICRKIYDNQGDEQADNYLKGTYTELNSMAQKFMVSTGNNKNIIIYASLEDFYFGSTIIHCHTRLSWCDNCIDKTSSSNTYICKKCNNSNIIYIKEDIIVNLPSGALNKYKSIHHEKGDSSNPKIIPGSLIISVYQKPSSRYERKDNHLIITEIVTLDEALCGFYRTINHINCKSFIIREECLSNFVDMKYIKNMGMPICNTSEYGDLIILYKTVFPSYVNIKAASLIRIIISHEARPAEKKPKEFKLTKKCTEDHISQNNFDVDACRQM